MDADAVGFFDDVAVGENVALRVNNYAGTQRTLADGPGIGATLTTLATEEAVKEVVKGAAVGVGVVVIVAGGAAQVAVRILDGALGVDVHDRGLELLGNLGKSIRELLRGGNGERGGIAGLDVFLALDAGGNDGDNQNPDGQGGRNGDGIGQAIRLEPRPE